MKPLIYALCDPRDQHVRYVGYTKHLTKRIHYHYRPPESYASQKVPSKTWPWLNELMELAMFPTVRILEWLEEGTDWEAREIYWITHFKELGEPLLNETGGGLGTLGRRWKLSPERRAQISVTNKQAWLNRTPEQRQAALEILAGGRKQRRPELDGPHAEEHKQAISRGLKKSWKEGTQRKEFSEDARRRIAEGVRRYWASRPESEKQEAVKRMHEKRWERNG